MLQNALHHAQTHRETHLSTLLNLLRIPSISTLSQHAADINRAADWLVSYMDSIGLAHVAKIDTDGYPVVYGEWLHAGADTPTLLVYGHYDVQPVDPLDEWQTPPFEPTIKDDNLYCRGVSDDKAQFFLILAAAASYLQSSGKLPLNLKFLIEGEEEISSPSLAPFVTAHKDKLAAEAILICDQPMLAPELPLIMYGVRGTCYMELTVRGPKQDLHSGTYGGAVDNPFNVLIQLLSRCVDPDTHKILIPSFYERVQEATAEEKQMMAHSPVKDDIALQLTGVPALAGETGYTTAERVSVRPTFEIHGIKGGFIDEGKKTMIPAQAAAKFSMRLVPDQHPADIAQKVEKHLRALAPPTVTLNFKLWGGSRPAVIDYKHPAVQAAAQAYERGLGHTPIYLRGGGSLPIVPDFQDILNVPVVLMGFGLPDDNLHAPNEKFYLPNFYKGIETIIHYFELLPKQFRG